MSSTRKQLVAPAQAPRALLCIHGAGGSAAIFRVQIAKLRAALRHEFEFVYATAPFRSSPGPGVLPLFRDMGPFFSWFEGNDNGDNTETAPSVDERLQAANVPLKETITKWQDTNPQIPIVGVIAFSEGALVASLLLWQQQMGQLPWLPTMSIALLICCYYQDEATEYIQAGSHDNEESVRINVPTLHLHGRQDFALEGSRKLVARHYSTQYADVLEFNGQHHFPNRRSDVEETVKRFQQLWQRK